MRDDKWDDESHELTHKQRINKNHRVSRTYGHFSLKEGWVYNNYTNDSYGYSVSGHQYNINNYKDLITYREEKVGKG